MRILATSLPKLCDYGHTKLLEQLPVLYIDGKLTEIQGVKTYAMRKQAIARARRAAQYLRRKSHPEATIITPIESNTARWEKLADKEARMYSPEIVPCTHCGYPRVTGYVCVHCEVREPAQKSKRG
jgi:hypothetical protein